MLIYLCSLALVLAGQATGRCESEGRAAAADSAPAFVEGRVADASDRAYEPAAIRLIDQAKQSVVMSMYLLREGEDDRHPVNRLLRDLLEAAHRGVRVELYLNTRFKGAHPEKILETPGLKRLKGAGARVTGLSPYRRLHDKLLIVDERYVLEGSTNWSIEALKVNWESNTLIDSPPLAREKLNRLRLLAAGPKEAAPAVRGRRPLPRTLEMPAAWIRRGGILPRMVSSGDERAFDTLLFLWLEMAAQGSPEFFVNLEELGLDAGLPESWDDSAVRRQMIKVLRKLKNNNPKLVDLKFTHGKDVWVKLTAPEGPTVTVPTDLIEPASAARTPAAVTYLRLLDLALQQEGLRLTELTQRELGRRTGLSGKPLRRALRALIPPRPQG